MAALHAVILADGPHALERVAGLTLRERARRVVVRAGAERVLVIEHPEQLATVGAWWREAPADRLLVVRARDQVIHTPLIAPIVAERGRVVAVAPAQAAAPDVPAGGYAGAFIVLASEADAVLAALAAGEADTAIGARLLADGAPTAAHGAIARHPVTSRDERKAAARLLYKIVHKPQDNAITRYLYRPISFPLTKLFLRTPITPNQISSITGAMVAIGIWLTAQMSMNRVIAGTALCLAAAYVDCCDGEVARLKLLSSKIGAWLDTIIDELSSVAYMLAIGWHCHLYFGPNYFGDLGFDPWIVTTWIGLATYLISIYCIYYNIIVMVGSANSQDYVGRFEAVPGDAPNTMRLRPVVATAVDTSKLSPMGKLFAVYLPNVVRRDFISWAALAFAVTHTTHAAFATLIAGGLGAVVVTMTDHIRLRLQRRAIVRSGQILVGR
ncbi:MAG: CDP-alcohol phosphatidyltransferase family protein [Deltaproteobacteria bacterium]|nr:CDP-alcohol phosphatidyltransferase family protein [Deltaproteobacteria bacterium]